MTASDVERRILTFIRSELVSSDVSINPDDELLSGAILDSMGVVRLAAFVQEEYQFKMQPADFMIENFRSVAVLAHFVRKGTSTGQ